MMEELVSAKLQTPLIYTSMGNLPIADLDCKVHWEDAETYTKFVERYFFKGELVRESAHVMFKKGLTAQAKQGGLGG
jgi:hypothetical protein